MINFIAELRKITKIQTIKINGRALGVAEDSSVNLQNGGSLNFYGMMTQVPGHHARTLNSPIHWM